ncbi:hypothetical protein AB833_02150 [Chromatiales bacterium (ex Bugula neritina AB1)]|nr:hypothetical protein AB833_02150 [Chromatiales bacterium (ex Bugula neritina AB1)]
MTSSGTEKLPATADVVIVGAGIAGLYCAWRLLEQNPSRNIVITERLNRTGGRLQTDLINIDGEVVREEEGGMRFNDSMVEFMYLCSSLKLISEFTPFVMSGPNDRYCVRGESFTDAEANAGDNSRWKTLYKLNPDEEHKSPGDIVGELFKKLLDDPGNREVLRDHNVSYSQPTPEFWQVLRLYCKWENQPLNKWQLWGLMRRMGYSEECINMVSATVGFAGPFLSRASAGEALQILGDFPTDSQYKTFRNGYSTLPDTLVERIEDQNGEIFINCEVQNIVAADNTDSGQPLYDLQISTQLAAAPSETKHLQCDEPGTTVKTIRTPHVILSVGSKALRSLYHSSSVLRENPHLWEDMHSVLEMRLLKINLYYDSPWWSDKSRVPKPVKAGPSFTDLPVNAVYPFYSLAGAFEEGPAALTLYCDFNNTNFWQGLQNIAPYFTSKLQHQHDEDKIITGCSQAVVDEATRQLQQVFDMPAPPPEPAMTSFRLWSGEDDFGYAYHQWALNADDAQVIPRMVELAPHLYHCNESYSDMQGWVNGSLRSADLVLKRFGIEPLGQRSGHTAHSSSRPTESSG